jgi:DNA-binding transcriptional LysR family regulator
MDHEPQVHNRRVAVAPVAASLHWSALVAFTRVAHHRNFARAAAELGVTPTAISKAIKQLEEQLGARLFSRTTRSVALTESGGQLLDSVGPALDQIRGSVERVTESAGRPRGALRLNTSYVAYASLLEPHLPAFLARYPDVRLEVSIDNGLSDIVARGFDAGIRLGHALQRDMIAVPLGPVQQLVVVAAPSYLARHGTPATPTALLEHDCIRQWLATPRRHLEWSFRRGGRSIAIDVGGRLVLDEMRSVLSAARLGCGLGYVFRHFAAAELARGDLVTVLDRHCPPREPFYLYYPNRGLMAGKLRAFIDFVQAANWEAPP